MSVWSPIVDQNPGTASHSRVLAGNGPARDLALAEGVPPVLDAQPASRGRVVCERHVAGGVQPSSFGAHGRVDGNGATRELESGRRGELAAGSYAGGHHHDLSFRPRWSRPDFERTVDSRDLVDLSAEADVDAFLLEPAVDAPRRFEIEARGIGLLLIGDQRHALTTPP